jgi:hypothetical protein
MLQFTYLINSIWRPLIDVVHDAPLALCDRRTVQRSDYLEVDKIHDDYLGENNYLQYNEAQRWFYKSDQRKDEPTVFLTWDSQVNPLYPGIVLCCSYWFLDD